MSNSRPFSEKYQTLQFRQCTPEFRQAVIESYPTLTLDHWLLLARLLFPKIEESTGNIIIDGTPEKLLITFSSKVQDILWSDYNYNSHKARVVDKNIRWPVKVLRALEQERQTSLIDTQKVYFISGEPVTKYRKYKQMDTFKSLTHSLIAHTPQAQEWLAYLNTLPLRGFQEVIIKNGPATLDAILKLERDVHHQWVVFSGIVEQYIQLYKPTERSVRLVPFSENHIGLLKREIRAVLTKGWHEMDLKHAQLAIAAKLWNVPSVTEFLSSGGNMWDLIAKETGITDEKLIKSCVYGLMYGAGEKTLSDRLGTGYLKFKRIRYISDLLAARKVMLKNITKDGGATDCYGHFIPVTKEVNTLSVLAQISQALEMKLLDPALQLAKGNKDKNGFLIVLYQYDGLSISVIRDSRVEFWKEKISFEVAEQAAKLGVVTHVEWK